MQTTLMWKHIFLSAYMLSPTKIHAGIKKTAGIQWQKIFSKCCNWIYWNKYYLLTNEWGIQNWIKNIINLEKIFCTIFQFFKIIVKGKNKKKAQNTQVWQIDGCGGKMGTKQDWKSFQGCDSCKSLHSLYIRMFFCRNFFSYFARK